MAAESAQLNYGRRRSDAFTAPAPPPKRSGTARPAMPSRPARPSRPSRPEWTPYEAPKREERREKPLPRREDDFHPIAPLKVMTPAEIRAMAVVVFAVTAIAMGIIFLSAQAAVAQKDINDLRKGIAQVDDDIANLKIEIEQAQNMQLIKDRAYMELGMSEPSFEQYVYIEELAVPQSNFGRYIKERAYGGARSQPAEPAGAEQE